MPRISKKAALAVVPGESQTDLPPIGHNQEPPFDFSKFLALPVAEVEVEAARSYEHFARRRDELLTGVAAFVPPNSDEQGSLIIANEKSAGAYADQIEQVRLFADMDRKTSTLERERAAVTKPVLEGKAAFDRYFKDRLSAPLMNAIAPLVTKLKAHQAARAEVERKRRAEEEAEKARLAEQAQRRAEQTRSDIDWARAGQAVSRAEQAARAAQAPLAELSRVTGELGAVTSLRRRMTWQVTSMAELVMAAAADPDLLDLLTVNEVEMNRRVSSGALTRCEGVRIYEVQY